MPLYKRVFPRWGDCYRSLVGGDATAGWEDMPLPDDAAEGDEL